MQAQDSWTIFPLLYLRANWSQKVYKHFGLDIQLIKADQETKSTMWETMQPAPAYAPCGKTEEGIMYLDVQWLVAIRLPRATEHLPPSKIGISFIDRVERSIISTLLTCLRLIRPTKVICPVSFTAYIDTESIKNNTICGCDDYYSAYYDEPMCECDYPDPFKEKDIHILTELWTSLVHLRKLDRWIDEPFQEIFFRDLDKRAGERTKQKLRSIFSRPDLSREITENIVKSFVEAKDELWQQYYNDALQKEFSKKEEQVFASRTRIGRALGLFDEGLHLSPLHSFLSMCIVLETLFTLGRGEVAHKLAVRLAKVVANKHNVSKRKDYYRRVKKVYRERGCVVHGSKLIEVVDKDLRQDAFTFTRLSLQLILCSQTLLKIYTGQGSLEDFFVEKLDLDL